MTRRDTYTLGVVAILGLVGVFWFLLLAPKRSELSKLDTKVSESQAALQTARQEAEQFAQARLDFPTDYTTVARLGKAVPVDPDIPSLVVQLDRAANRARVDFRKLTTQSGAGTEAAPAAAPPAPAAPSGDAAGGGGATGASGAADTGATGAASPTGDAGATGASGASSPTTVAANAIVTPTVPLGVDVGPAGLAVSKFDFEFQGSFFRMAELLHNVRTLVQRRNRQLVVSGRLVSIGGISMVEGDDGFPQVQTTVAATAYLVPKGQGLFAGATTQGPADAGTATPAPPAGATPSVPPAAVVSPR